MTAYLSVLVALVAASAFDVASQEGLGGQIVGRFKSQPHAVHVALQHVAVDDAVQLWPTAARDVPQAGELLSLRVGAASLATEGDGGGILRHGSVEQAEARLTGDVCHRRRDGKESQGSSAGQTPARLAACGSAFPRLLGRVGVGRVDDMRVVHVDTVTERSGSVNRVFKQETLMNFAVAALALLAAALVERDETDAS